MVVRGDGGGCYIADGDLRPALHIEHIRIVVHVGDVRRHLSRALEVWCC